MIYFDTSYLARLYLCDAGYDAVRNLAATDRVACATHGEVELFAVFHRKLREGALDTSLLAAVLSQYDAERKLQAILWLELTPPIIQSACNAFRTLAPTVFLRAADALHLACAREHGFGHIYTNDQHVLAAAPHFGLVGADVIPPTQP